MLPMNLQDWSIVRASIAVSIAAIALTVCIAIAMLAWVEVRDYRRVTLPTVGAGCENCEGCEYDRFHVPERSR